MKSGQEGPKHDPYGYTEIVVERDGCEVVIHCGLGTWMEVDGILVPRKARHNTKQQEAYITRRFRREIGWDAFEVIAACLKADKHRARKLYRSTGLTFADIEASERAAGWDPNP